MKKVAEVGIKSWSEKREVRSRGRSKQRSQSWYQLTSEV